MYNDVRLEKGYYNVTGKSFTQVLTELDPEAFQGCTALQSVNLPSTLATIGSAVFEGCSPRLVCRTVSGSAADRWCRSQRISTQPCRPDSSAVSAQEPRGGGRVCPYCGGRISLISGVCKRCGK